MVIHAISALEWEACGFSRAEARYTSIGWSEREEAQRTQAIVIEFKYELLSRDKTALAEGTE